MSAFDSEAAAAEAENILPTTAFWALVAAVRPQLLNTTQPLQPTYPQINQLEGFTPIPQSTLDPYATPATTFVDTTEHAYNTTATNVVDTAANAYDAMVTNDFGVTPNWLHLPQTTYPLEPAILHLRPLPLFARPERYVDLHMCIQNLAPWFNKIHLAKQNVGLAKHLSAKPREIRAKNHDTLELSVTVHNGEQDQDKWSAVMSDLVFNQYRPPAQGGPLSPCTACIRREEKRQTRTKNAKDPADPKDSTEMHDKIEVWLQNLASGQHMAGVDMYEHENLRRLAAVEGETWDGFVPQQDLTTNHFNDPMVVDEPNPVSNEAVYLNKRLRIICRCSQQNVNSFCVVFTFKDFLGECVAQTLSSPIVIRDEPRVKTKASEESL